MSVEVFESSLNNAGVIVIFRVSLVSSLKNESVLRTVPFRDLPEDDSSGNF